MEQNNNQSEEKPVATNDTSNNSNEMNKDFVVSKEATPQGGVNVVINQTMSQNQQHLGHNGVLERSHVTAIILAVLLGWCGADRFYLGNPGLGLLKLFTGGLFGIMWFIDIILIATKSVKGIVWTK